jgi:hypothetical protein
LVFEEFVSGVTFSDDAECLGCSFMSTVDENVRILRNMFMETGAVFTCYLNKKVKLSM